MKTELIRISLSLKEELIREGEKMRELENRKSNPKIHISVAEVSDSLAMKVRRLRQEGKI